MNCQPLDQQRSIDAQDINTVAQPLGPVGQVDKNIVARAQGRRHRISLDADQRELRGRRCGQRLQPAGFEGKVRPSAFLARNGTGSGRSPDRDPCHRHQFAKFGGCIVRQSAEHRFRNLEITRQSPSLALLQLPRRPFAEILLDIGVVAPDQPRQRGEILPPLRAQHLQHLPRVRTHEHSINPRKIPRQVGNALEME